MEGETNDLRPILIGKTIPNIKTYKEDGSPLNIHEVKSPILFDILGTRLRPL